MSDSNKNNIDQEFQKLDQEKFKQEIKEEAVREARESLISSIQGKKKRFAWEEKGKEKPDNYNDLFEEVDRRVPKKEEIEKLVDEKLKIREEKERQQLLKKQEQKQEEFKKQKQQFDNEWWDLVNKGKMPAPDEKITERINKGEKLTKDEILADEGLKARLKLAQLSQNTGKSAKLAYYEDFSDEPAGTKAPVIGSKPRAPKKESKELSYEDIQKARKEAFGF